MPSDRGLRILLAAPETTGGIGKHVQTLAAGLVSRGHAVSVCAPRTTLERLDLLQDSRSAHVEAIDLPLGELSAWRYRKRVKALAGEHDVIHAHGVRVGAQLAIARATPLVVTWHNAPLGSSARRGVHAGLERWCAQRAAVVIGASADLVARAQEAGARNPRLLAVAAPELPTATVGPRPELHQPPTVLALARLHRQKRLDLLIDAAANWPEGPHRPRFLIAGDGPLLGALREQARAQNAPVTFLGAAEDVAALLAQADVVALPSDWEARPLVAQEALRAGVPVVATDVGGVRDLVGQAAVLVPPGDSRALADGLRCVLEDASRRAELQHAGPARAAEWPTVEQMLDELIAIYLAVASNPRRGG